MDKLFLTAFFTFIFVSASDSQNRWFSTSDFEFIVPKEIEYNYSLENNIGYGINLESKPSFALSYAINYPFFRKFSVGLLSGVQLQNGASFFALKLGSNLKYYFVDVNNVYTYLQYASNFTVNREKFKFGDNMRVGIGFPAMKREAFNLNINIFYDFTGYNLSGSEPLIFGNEKPSSIFFRSYGISLGVKF